MNYLSESESETDSCNVRYQDVAYYLVLSAFVSTVNVLYQRVYLDLIIQDWNLARIGQNKT